MKDLTFRDWLYIAAIVGAAFVQNYRIGELEKRFLAFESSYVRRDVFELTMTILHSEIANGDRTEPKETHSVR